MEIGSIMDALMLIFEMGGFVLLLVLGIALIGPCCNKDH